MTKANVIVSENIGKHVRHEQYGIVGVLLFVYPDGAFTVSIGGIPRGFPVFEQYEFTLVEK